MIKDEKTWTLAVEEATNQIQALIKSCLLHAIPKEEIKKQALAIIDDTAKYLEDNEAPQGLIVDTTNSLKKRFVDWYRIVERELEKNAKNKPLISTMLMTIQGKIDNKAQIFIGQIDNAREYVTTQESASGQAYFNDYIPVVKKCMQTIASKQLIMVDSMGRRMSIRNLAEMTARYQVQQQDIEKLKEQGIEYVVASTHNNSSKRCEMWQGKIFLLDVEPNRYVKQNVDLRYKPIPIGRVDGHDIYSLADAMKHGFLGYNCRHRLVKYQRGMDLFKQYNADTIERERRFEQKQRSLERRIRQAKKDALLSVTADDRKKYTEKSKYLQAYYKSYCSKHNLTRLTWRTRISMDERAINPRYDGDGARWHTQIASELLKVDDNE